MTKQINVKAMCACGEEVTEKDMQGIVSMCDTSDEAIMRRYREEQVAEILEDAVDKIVAVFQGDRATEFDPTCACCNLNHPSRYSCMHCDPKNKKLDKSRTSAVC
jgi:hypothetical protein